MGMIKKLDKFKEETKNLIGKKKVERLVKYLISRYEYGEVCFSYSDLKSAGGFIPIQINILIPYLIKSNILSVLEPPYWCILCNETEIEIEIEIEISRFNLPDKIFCDGCEKRA